MGRFLEWAKSAGKILPFTKATLVYFIMDAHNTGDEYWSTILKCAPIIGLIIFILLFNVKKSKTFTYTHKILLGLVFSSIGDALLNHDYFPHGMAAFAIAQLFYISAFGFEPLIPLIGIVLYAGAIATVYILHTKLDLMLLMGLPIYTTLLVTMCWRAIARMCTKNDARLLRVICAIASLLFVISDAMIAINKYHTPIKNASFRIMITYYAAQFGITMSITEFEAEKPDEPTVKPPNKRTEKPKETPAKPKSKKVKRK